MVAVAKPRDWIHCEGPPEDTRRFPDSVTACGRALSTDLQIVALRDWEKVDCPTCTPIAQRRGLELDADDRRPEWLRELRKVEDAAPFLPVLADELRALGAGVVDWTVDVISRRGFYVVAIRKDGRVKTFWIRYRSHAQYAHGRDDEHTLVQIADELPGDRPAQEFITVSPNVEFVAAAIMWSLR